MKELQAQMLNSQIQLSEANAALEQAKAAATPLPSQSSSPARADRRTKLRAAASIPNNKMLRAEGQEGEGRAKRDEKD